MFNTKTTLITCMTLVTAIAAAQSEGPATFALRAGAGILVDHKAVKFAGSGGFFGGISYIPKWRSLLAGSSGEPSLDLDVMRATAHQDRILTTSIFYAERVPFAHGAYYPSNGPYWGLAMGATQVATNQPNPNIFAPPLAKSHYTLAAQGMLGATINTHFFLETSFRYVLKTFGYNASSVNMVLGYRF